LLSLANGRPGILVCSVSIPCSFRECFLGSAAALQAPSVGYFLTAFDTPPQNANEGLTQTFWQTFVFRGLSALRCFRACANRYANAGSARDFRARVKKGAAPFG
jgi:hypothetical protein